MRWGSRGLGPGGILYILGTGTYRPNACTLFAVLEQIWVSLFRDISRNEGLEFQKGLNVGLGINFWGIFTLGYTF